MAISLKYTFKGDDEMDAPIRSMPQNLEAEQSVLGSMLIDKTAIAQAAEVLNAEDF